MGAPSSEKATVVPADGPPPALTMIDCKAALPSLIVSIGWLGMRSGSPTPQTNVV